jgi:hypothetical protein
MIFDNPLPPGAPSPDGGVRMGYTIMYCCRGGRSAKLRRLQKTDPPPTSSRRSRPMPTAARMTMRPASRNIRGNYLVLPRFSSPP